MARPHAFRLRCRTGGRCQIEVGFVGLLLNNLADLPPLSLTQRFFVTLKPRDFHHRTGSAHEVLVDDPSIPQQYV